MKPLKISMLLSTPIVFPVKVKPYPLMFDSILVRLVARRNGRYDYDSNIDLYAPGENDKVPLAACGNKQKFYMASAIEIPKEAAPMHTSVNIIKRVNWVEENGFESLASWNVRAISTGTGINRNYREVAPAILTPLVNFYCVGDNEKIEDLLSDLTCIGSKVSIGMGRIVKTSVSVISKDLSLIDANGYPARPIPVSEHSGGEKWLKDYCSYKSPYWHVGNKTMCWIPPLYRWYPV